MAYIAHNALHKWHEQVEEARSTDEVIGHVQDFIAMLAPLEITRLPEDCRPRAIRDASDIDYWNVRLADTCRALWGTRSDLELLTEVSQLFLRASVRVSRLAADRALPPS